MGKFSTYRYLELKDENSHINIRSRSTKQPRRLRKIFITLIVIAICATYLLGLFAGQTQWFDGLAKTLGYESIHHYAVIIDAGSSGSRVLAYKFRVPYTVFGQTNLDLVEELFEQTKPGLSSYADDPAKVLKKLNQLLNTVGTKHICRLQNQQMNNLSERSQDLLRLGADTIVQLIKKAEFLIPLEKRKSTPLIVRATAGLRLLPKEKAQQLIDKVSEAIRKLGYATDQNAVEIMDGSDEGIFIWYTVNLLHNLIDDVTMAALDLGGGSTQITYQLSEEEARLFPSSDQFVIPIRGPADNITLYTHSYLNLGLLAARYGTFRLEANDNATNEFSSVCVDPIIQKEMWTYANKQYSISGALRVNGMKRDAVYERCHSLVKRYVLSTLDWEPKQAPKAIAAMSYFYDVAADVGMIDVMKGGTVTVGQYRSSAQKACSSSNVDQPWACFELTYCVTLLHDAYKIPDNEPISLFKKVNGHEVSWALGLAYTTVMNRIAITV